MMQEKFITKYFTLIGNIIYFIYIYVYNIDIITFLGNNFTHISVYMKL